MYEDVVEFCMPSSRCQKAALISLPVISEPFEQIAMDIVGPLPVSHQCSRYVLAVCDYTTCYPEAVPLCTTDAEQVAEALVVLFFRIWVLREILTDQESNLTSQLLAEVYQLLHIRSIRTSPYHPQMDGW